MNCIASFIVPCPLGRQAMRPFDVQLPSLEGRFAGWG